MQQLCIYTAKSLCFSSQKVSHQAHIWWTAWWLAPVDEESSKAIHSSEKQLSPSLSPTPWACMRMSPRPCLNVWHSLSLEMQTTHTYNTQSDGCTPRLTHTKGRRQTDYRIPVLSSNVMVSWKWPAGTANCLRNTACQHSFTAGSPGLWLKQQKLTGEALWPRATPGRHFCSCLRVK